MYRDSRVKKNMVSVNRFCLPGMEILWDGIVR